MPRRSTTATPFEIIDFLTREFPQTRCIVEEVGHHSATIIHPVGVENLRPGNTVHGPLLMTVAERVSVSSSRSAETLAVGEVFLYSDRSEPMVAHAVGTYSIPPQRA